MLAHKPRQIGEAPSALAGEANVIFIMKVSMKLRVLLFLFLAICASGCTGYRKYSYLGGNGRAVLEGHVVSVQSSGPRPLLMYRHPLKKITLYPHEQARVVVDYIDVNPTEVQFGVGDTIAVHCLASAIEYSATGEGVYQVDGPGIFVPDWPVGLSGVFCLGAFEGELLPRRFVEIETAKAEEYQHNAEAKYDGLTRDSRLNW